MKRNAMKMSKARPHASRFILVLELFSLSTFLRLIFLRPTTNSVDYSWKVIYSDSKLFIPSPYYALKRSRNGHFKLDRCLLNVHPISYSFHGVKYFWIHCNAEKTSGCVVLSRQKKISKKEREAERINCENHNKAWRMGACLAHFHGASLQKLWEFFFPITMMIGDISECLNIL